MRSFQGIKGTIFHYSSDFSGCVEISNKEETMKVELPASDLVEFIICTYVRDHLVRRLERILEEITYK